MPESAIPDAARIAIEVQKALLLTDEQRVAAFAAIDQALLDIEKQEAWQFARTPTAAIRVPLEAHAQLRALAGDLKISMGQVITRLLDMLGNTDLGRATPPQA